MTDMVAEVRGHGPPVVLLHGQPGSAADWGPVATLLETDFTVIVPDRPGYGGTGGRATGFRGNAAAVGALLDRLGLPAATIVGHSWSGGIGIAMAGACPSRVAGLVLVSSVGPGDALSRVDRALAIQPVGSTVIAISLNIAGRALSVPVVRQYFDRRLRGTTDEALVAMADAWRTGGVWRSYVIEQKALVDELSTLTPVLVGIGVPTVVLIGETDHIVPPATGEHLAAAIPGARLVRIPGVGHRLPSECPEAVAAAVFEVSPGGGS